MLSILVVDDEAPMCRTAKRVLVRFLDDVDVDTAQSKKEALEELAKKPYDVVVSDNDMWSIGELV